MSLNFVIRGRVVSAEGVALYAEKAKPKVAREREAQHMGFVVEGYPPGMVDEAERLARENLSRWLSHDDEQRRKLAVQGKREPKPWDIDDFMRKNKRKRVLKPYSMPEAAEQCKALAAKQGWTHLVVTELIREAS
jgi:hypothetical protein